MTPAHSVTQVHVAGYDVELVKFWDDEEGREGSYILARNPAEAGGYPQRFSNSHPIFPALIEALASLIEKSEALVEAVEEIA